MKDYKKLLLSELISILVYYPNDAVVKKEIVNRLTFCGFDKETVFAIIKSEMEIVKKRELKDMPPLYKSYIWLDKNNDLVGKKKFLKIIKNYTMCILAF